MLHILKEHDYGYLRQKGKVVKLCPEIYLPPPAPLMPSTLVSISLCIIYLKYFTYSSSSTLAAHEEI